MSLIFHVNAGSNPNYFVVLVEYEDGDGELSGVDLKEALDSDTWLMAPHGTIVGCSFENQHGVHFESSFLSKAHGGVRERLWSIMLSLRVGSPDKLIVRSSTFDG